MIILLLLGFLSICMSAAIWMSDQPDTAASIIWLSAGVAVIFHVTLFPDLNREERSP